MPGIAEQFESVLREYVKPCEPLAAAVSGGADSMCLLSLLLNAPYLKKENLTVVSVDHKIRGEASENDLKFVEAYCAASGVRFLPFTVDVPALAALSKNSVETEAREQRYRIFRSLGVKVLTAHHAGDNAESILMHIFRGSGLNGLCGMEIFREGFLLRPLLNVSKHEIERYVTEGNVPYISDATNADITYTRNFIRHEILPRVKEKYPGAEEAVLRLSKEARAALDCINPDGENLIVEPDSIKILIPKDSAEAGAVLLNASVRAALKKLGAKDVSRKHIESAAALSTAQNGAGADLPGGIRAVREYEYLTLYRPDFAQDAGAEVKFKTGKTEWNGVTIEVCKAEAGAKKALRFDLKKIPENAVIRNRRDGDVFCPFGGGTRKLKEYLIDKKIPARLRNRLVCIAADTEILAIAGVEISDKIKVEADSDIFILAEGSQE